jgi:hypothetical protein
MKKTIAILAIIVSTLLLVSCAAEPLTTTIKEPTPPTEVSAESPSYGNTSSTKEENLPELSEIQAVVGEWIYYLDLNNPIQVNDSEEYPLHRAKKDGSGDEDLKVTGIDMTVTPDFIYTDINEQMGKFRHWDTLRVSLDGSEVRTIGYQDTIRFSSAESDKMLFTSFNNNTIYISDTGCENVKPLKVNIPDLNSIEKAIAADTVFTIVVTDMDTEWIYFDYAVFYSSEEDERYAGGYRISQDGSKIEKTDDGEYYSYEDVMEEETGD